jgi:hypothetical protein
MLGFDSDFFIPFLVFSVPLVAIVGGITAGIVRTIGQQRLLELHQRERIAAIERGVDLSKLPAMPVGRLDDDLASLYVSPYESARRRSQGLMIGGLVTLAVGVSLAVFLGLINTEKNVWAVGLIPGTVGIALLLSAWLVHPRDDRSPGPNPPARMS